MPNFDGSNTFKPTKAVNDTAVTGNGTTTGNIVDTNGYLDATILIETGARTDGTITPIVYESDDSGMSGEVAVDDKWLTVTEASVAISAANTTKAIGYVGKKRYIRTDLVASAVTTGLRVSALCIQGRPRVEPVS